MNHRPRVTVENLDTFLARLFDGANEVKAPKPNQAGSRDVLGHLGVGLLANEMPLPKPVRLGSFVVVIADGDGSPASVDLSIRRHDGATQLDWLANVSAFRNATMLFDPPDITLSSGLVFMLGFF